MKSPERIEGAILILSYMDPPLCTFARRCANCASEFVSRIRVRTHSSTEKLDIIQLSQIIRDRRQRLDGFGGLVAISMTAEVLAYAMQISSYLQHAIRSDNDRMMNRCATELLEYFSGKRSVFDLKLFEQGTDFQKQVWRACGLIPYGQTSTPQDVARSIGKPGSYRAVGTAVKDNPIAILIPAHRVVLSSGYVSKRDDSAKLRAPFRERERKHSGL